MTLSEKSMGVQFNLENLIAEVRERRKSSAIDTISYLRSEWEKFNGVEQFQLFAFAVLDLSISELKDDDD